MVQKFTFNRSFHFDQDEGPVYTQDQLQQAETIAHQRGFAQGQAQVQRMLESQIKDLIVQLQGQLPQLIEREASYRKAIAQGMADIFQAGIHQVVLPIVRNHALQGIQDLVQTVVRKVEYVQGLKITIHPDLVDQLQHHTQSQDWPIPLTLIGESSMELGDVKITWADGGLDYMIQKAVDDVQNLIQQQLTQAIQNIGESHE